MYKLIHFQIACVPQCYIVNIKEINEPPLCKISNVFLEAIMLISLLWKSCTEVTEITIKEQIMTCIVGNIEGYPPPLISILKFCWKLKIFRLDLCFSKTANTRIILIDLIPHQYRGIFEMLYS